MGKLLYECVEIPEADYITYVPLSSQKLIWRGYNQAQVIAETLASHISLPVYPLLVKVIDTQSQASMKNKKNRKNNTVSVYTVNYQYEKLLKDKRILIIDDVCTTGSTLNECAKALKAAQATTVTGLVVSHKTA